VCSRKSKWAGSRKKSLVEQPAAVAFEILGSGGAYPAAQASFQHGQLARGHLDSGIVMDEPGQPREIALAQMIARNGLAGGGNGHGSSMKGVW
jgi:hypothetical protein